MDAHPRSYNALQTSWPWIQWLYFGIIVFTLCHFGGVDVIVQSVMTLMLCTIGVLTRARSPEGGVLNIWLVAVTFLFILLAFTYSQSIRVEGNPFEHMVWDVVRKHLGPVEGSISAAPGQTLASMVSFAPILGFILSLSLFQGLPEALAMLRRLCYLSAALASYGIFQILFIMNSDDGGRPVYISGLNSVFVNRNSAGAFFGISALMTTSFTFYYMRSVDLSRIFFLGWQLFDANTHAYRMFFVFSVLTMLEVVTLSLTKSRGATGATFLAFLLLVGLTAQRRMLSRRTIARPALLVKGARVAVSALLATGIFYIFTEQIAYRIESEGVDYNRVCIFKSTVAAIQDNWKLGAGFGAFSNVFPAYRNAECGGIEGVWDAAHNFFLEGTLGLGIVFPAILLGGLTILIKTFLFGMRVRRQHRFVPDMGLSVLFLICLHSTVDFSLQIPGIGLFAATVLACCCVISLESCPYESRTRTKNCRH
jgi:hypothetical protein